MPRGGDRSGADRGGRATLEAVLPGVRLVELVGAQPALESAVVTRTDDDHLSTQAFLRVVTRTAKSSPALSLAA